MALHQAVLLPMPYLPSVGWFVKLRSIRYARLFCTETLYKTQPRNRCRIATAQGAQRLSVPLAGGRGARITLNEAKPADNNKWQREHIHALQTAYGKSPFFMHYADSLFSAMEGAYPSLAHLNGALIKRLLELMRLEADIELQTCADTSPHSGGVVEWDDAHHAVYPQVFNDRAGFIAGCSAVDLLFNCGPDAIKYLNPPTL